MWWWGAECIDIWAIGPASYDQLSIKRQKKAQAPMPHYSHYGLQIMNTKGLLCQLMNRRASPVLGVLSAEPNTRQVQFNGRPSGLGVAYSRSEWLSHRACLFSERIQQPAMLILKTQHKTAEIWLFKNTSHNIQHWKQYQKIWPEQTFDW